MRYLVLGKDRPAADAPPSAYRLAHSFRYVEIWRNDGAYPRFLNPTNVRMLDVGVMPDVTQFIDTDFASVLWLTPRDADDHDTGRASEHSCRGSVRSETLRVANTVTTIRTEAASPGWIVAGDLDYPGWTAELDGQSIPIHRANGMFRAVCVPAGEHELSFVFHPWGMVAYAWRHRG